MGDEASDPVDAVIFFDANMPKMDKCSDNCQGKDLVFCAHKFLFRAHIDHPGKALERLDDFHVLQYFFGHIYKNWHNIVPKPLFILVSKDEDFLEVDAPQAYEKAVKAQKNEIGLIFCEDHVSDGVDKIFIVSIPHKSCGTNWQDNLRCTIRELNKFWQNRQDS